MPQIPLSRASYKRADLPPTYLVNCYYEAVPTRLQDNVSLFFRPRIKQFALCGDGPMRGLYREDGVLSNTAFEGFTMALSGDTLYRVTTAGVSTAIDTISGPNRMSAAGNTNVVVLTAGTQPYYTEGAVRTLIAFPDDKNVYAVDTLNGYFLFASELGRFYWSAIGGTTVNPLDYATAESKPDAMLTLLVLGDEIWLMCRQSVEVWQPTGDADLPFQRITGRVFGIGITARDTARKFNVNGTDTMCWVGTDRKVYQTAPNPVPISDRSMEEKLRQASSDDIDGMYAATATWNGHDFYILHIPGQGSWAYDLTTRFWDEWGSYGRDLFRGAVSTIGPNGQSLIGDDEAGVIYELSTDIRTDADDFIVGEWSGLLEMSTGNQRCNNVMLICSIGMAPDPEDDPMVHMDYSDDKGQTWISAGDQPLGRQGERATRVLWKKLRPIKSPGRVFRWRSTEPITIQEALYNVELR